MSDITIEQIAGADVEPVLASDEQLVAMLVDRARSEGLQLTGEGGLLQQLTKRVLESALEGEITDHLGYEKHDAEGRGSGNSRNGTGAKTVLTALSRGWVCDCLTARGGRVGLGAGPVLRPWRRGRRRR
jgi:hypothetical protein